MGFGKKKLNKRGLGIFFAAAFFGLIIIVVSFFLDTEALFNRKIGENLLGGYSLGFGGSSSNATIQADQVMFSLKCPMVITQNDHTTIQVAVDNPSEKDAIRIMEMTITNGYTQDKTKQIIPMDPGGKETLHWEISSENALYGFLILARGFLHPYEALPSLGGTCGILVLDIPWLTGGQLLWGSIGLSTLGMAIGILLSIRSNRPINVKRWKRIRSLIIVAVAMIIGMLLVFLEFWYASFFITVIAILLVPVVFLDMVVYN